jgi:hypothetical protein
VNIDDYVSSIDTETAAAPASLATGQSNRVFVQVHNRSLTAVPGSSVRVLLLVTPVSAGLPALPAGYATHIQNGDPPGSPAVAGSGWLYGSSWYAADPASPYKSPPSAVDVRTPGVVEFSVDFKNIPSAALTDHVCAAAFITTAADPLTSTEPSLDVLTMHDKHAVHRNLHLVAAGATPAPGDGGFSHSPKTIALDFHNATEGVPIPGRGFVTAVVNLRAPDEARPGDHYRFNIVQRRAGALVGGSTYVYTIVSTDGDHDRDS